MDENPDATHRNSAALIGWGMTLLAVGALLVFANLSRRAEGEAPGFAALGWIVLLFGWGLLTGGLVTLAQGVDRLNRRQVTAPASAGNASTAAGG